MLSNKIKYYLASFRKKGIAETFKQVGYDYYYNRKFSHYNFIFVATEPYTATNSRASSEVLDKAKGRDGTLDSPTSSYYVFKYFKALKLNAKGINLLDIGCGSGKILTSGIILGFNKVTGVDLDSKALIRAEENCKKAEKTPATTKYEIINFDAAEFQIPGDINVIFLANPFYEATMKNVVSNISLSYRENKRLVYVIYHCPLYASLFDEDPAFKTFYRGKLIDGRPEVIIYQME